MFRRLAELGYHRSAKKCREKFENIYKYHRRTKEGRCGKPNGGKTYRFFEQLKALESHPLPPPPSSEGQQHEVSAKSTTAPTTHVPPDNNNVNVIQDAVPCSVRFPSENVAEHSSSTTSSEGGRRKKRKLTQFFEGLMREVIERQETLQRKFMEVLDRCERDRIAREEAWKMEELARIKRERELLAQERSIAAAKDEAVLAFLKKITDNAAGTVQLPEKIQVPSEKDKGMQENANGNGDGEGEKQQGGNVGVGNFIHMSSSRWPRDEVEALIRLRTEMDVQSQGNGSNNKGPLWEEISLAMKKLGYDRSAKRCKEKWENINKYFKRMKEKNRRKPMDSKTCPYYHHLEALYSKKPKKEDGSAAVSGNELKPEELLMHIMGSQEERQQQLESSSEDAEGENTDQNQGDNEDQGGYQMVENSPPIPIMS